jgi:hypothetical protein
MTQWVAVAVEQGLVAAFLCSIRPMRPEWACQDVTSRPPASRVSVFRSSCAALNIQPGRWCTVKRQEEGDERMCPSLVNSSGNPCRNMTSAALVRSSSACSSSALLQPSIQGGPGYATMIERAEPDILFRLRVTRPFSAPKLDIESPVLGLTVIGPNASRTTISRKPVKLISLRSVRKLLFSSVLEDLGDALRSSSRSIITLAFFELASK